MATLNKVMLMGRLTADPDAPRRMQDGGSVVTVRLAVGRSRKNPQTGQWENDPNPLFIDCDAWSGPNAKRDLVSLIHQRFRKGDPIFIEGRLRFEQWEDKNGGGKRSRHKVLIDNIEFIGNASGQQQGGQTTPQPQSAAPQHYEDVPW